MCKKLTKVSHLGRARRLQNERGTWVEVRYVNVFIFTSF